MFSPHDTIVAIATPPGRGSIGVVRLSGAQASAIASRLLQRPEPLAPRHATLTRVIGIRDNSGWITRRIGAPSATGSGSHECGHAIDQVIATYFPSPASYTGEDVIELSAHGSPVLLREIVSAAVDAGARLAEPGEFTLRAFLNGRIDLVQAEAVADLIDAVTPRQARVAFDQLEGTLTGRIAQIDARLFELITHLEASLDFPEEAYHFLDAAGVSDEIDAISGCLRVLLGSARGGRLIREGRHVAIVGKANVGKSSLFNYLLDSERAIVTEIPGTTRDLLSEVVDIEGIPVTLVDTAGLRDTTDVAEAQGVERTKRALGVAELALVMLDRSQPLQETDTGILVATAGVPRLIVVNKADLPAAWHAADLGLRVGATISLTARTGLTDCRRSLADALGAGERLRETPAVTNLRHVALLERARLALDRAAAASRQAVSEEFVLTDLQDARHALEEITGVRSTEDILAGIFQRFCIGK